MERRLVSQTPVADERIPVAVLEADAWPLWRRWLRWPAPMARLREERWRKVVEGVRQLNGEVGLAFPPPRRAGIFNGSAVMWDHLAQTSPSIDKASYGGWCFKGAQGNRSRMVNPYGALAQTIRVPDFDFDITEIAGICNSKSNERHFDSVPDFGRDFTSFKQVPVDEAGLATMTRHREIRLIHSPGSDTLMLQAWDGRLFVCNGGGSHHLAGAAYIAHEIGRPLPLRAQLSLGCLNAPAWRWLLEQFFVLHVPRNHRVLADVAMLAGAAYLIDLPNWVSQSSLLLMPRQARVSRDIVDIHLTAGVREVAEDIAELLRLQATTVRELGQRFPALCPQLERIPG